MPAPFRLTLLTPDPAFAAAADAAGVDLVGVDTERLGKHLRQKAVRDARISDHTLEDLGRYAPRLVRAEPFARLNPLHPGLGDEVEHALVCGARALMLPQFRTPREVEAFVALVAGRARVHLLVETAGAVERLDDILRVPGVDEVMVGLNDLHLELGMRHPMEAAVSPLMDKVAERMHLAGRRFGFGGVARPGIRGLPFSPDAVLARYAELGATSAWISRSFFHGGLGPESLAKEVGELRLRIDHWFRQPAAAWQAERSRLRAEVEAVAVPRVGAAPVPA